MGKYRVLGAFLDRVFRNDLNANFNDVDTDIQSQKKRVDDLIVANPQPSEVQDARGGFTVLRDRLDSTDVQLADIVTLVSNYAHLVVNGDWSQAIQQAVNEASENQEIHFPNGEFNFSNVLINKPIKISGKGVLKKNNQSNKLFVVDFSNTPYTHLWNTFELKDVTVDGNDQNAIGIEDVIVSNIGRLRINNVKFKNPSKASVNTASNINEIEIIQSKFNDGMYFSGITSSTATFHILNTASAKLTVSDNTFETDIVFDGGNGTSTGVIKAAPIAIYSENAKGAIIKNNKIFNAGHIDMYSRNHECIVSGNQIEYCHHPAIKVQESRNISIDNNRIKNNKCLWSFPILVTPYIRASTYGSLEPEQYYGSITNNIVDGSENGGITVSGTKYEAAINARDTTITSDLIAKGYKISGNTIRNTKMVGINLSYTADCEVTNNTVEKWGRKLTGSTDIVTGIRIIEPRGYNKISGNTLNGNSDSGTSNGIMSTYSETTGINANAYIDILYNKIFNVTTYPVFVARVNIVDVSHNTFNKASGQTIRISEANVGMAIYNKGIVDPQTQITMVTVTTNKTVS